MAAKRPAQNRIKKLILTAFLMAVLVLTAGCSYGGNGRVVFTMNIDDNYLFSVEKGDVRKQCTAAEAAIYLKSILLDYRDIVGDEVLKGEHREELYEGAKSLALSRIVQVKALNIFAQTQGISLTESEREQCRGMAQAFAERQQGGTDMELVTHMYEEYMLADKVYRSTVASIKTEISDDEALVVRVDSILFSYYDKQGKKRNEEEMAAELARAEDALHLLEAGASFDEVLNRYNEDSVSSYSVNRTFEDPVFAETAFSLSDGEFSGVIEAKDGYRIVKCVNHYDKPATEANKERLVNERRQQAFEEQYNAFAEDLEVDLNDSKWEDVSPDGLEGTSEASFFTCYAENVSDK